QINDVLLTALAEAWADWSGNDVLLVDLEGHGREELHDVDLSRTVGWFTTHFPVLLEALRGAEPAANLKRIKEQLRKVPNKGIGCAWLRSPSGFPLSPSSKLSAREHAEHLSALPNAEVIFNSLGQIDAPAAETGYVAASEPSGKPVSPRNPPRYPLNIAV